MLRLPHVKELTRHILASNDIVSPVAPLLELPSLAEDMPWTNGRIQGKKVTQACCCKLCSPALALAGVLEGP